MVGRISSSFFRSVDLNPIGGQASRRISTTPHANPFKSATQINDVTPSGPYTPPFLITSVQTPHHTPQNWMIFGYTGHSQDATTSIQSKGFLFSTFTTLQYGHAASHAGPTGRVLTIGMPCDTFLNNLSNASGTRYTMEDLTDFVRFNAVCQASLGFEETEYLSKARNDYILYEPIRRAVMQGAIVIDQKDPSSPVNTPTDRLIYNRVFTDSLPGAKNTIWVKLGLMHPDTVIKTFGRLSLPNPNES